MEGASGEVEGLGLLDVETELTTDKTLCACAGVSTTEGAAFAGYEMHVGLTQGPDSARPMLTFPTDAATARSRRDGAIRACYVHGLFAHEEFRGSLLNWIGGQTSDLAYEAEVERTLDALADHLARHVDLDALLALRDKIATHAPHPEEAARKASSKHEGSLASNEFDLLTGPTGCPWFETRARRARSSPRGVEFAG